jgi:hypothetical protein
VAARRGRARLPSASHRRPHGLERRPRGRPVATSPLTGCRMRPSLCPRQPYEHRLLPEWV